MPLMPPRRLGVFTVCAPHLRPAQGAASLVSPLFVMFVVRRGTGVPVREWLAAERWGAL